MSGSISPKSIGLTNPMTIKTIIKKTRFALKVTAVLTKVYTTDAFFLSFFVFVFKVSFTEFVFIGVPHTIIFTLAVKFVLTNLFYHIIYFYIISYYLKLKLNQINTDLRFAIKMKIMVNLNIISKTLYRIYCEINEFNAKFWSKFIFIIWMSISAVIANSIFMFTFGGNKLNLNIRIILFIVMLFGPTLLLILIETGGSLSLEAKKTYKLFASYKFVCMRNNIFVIPRTRYAIKVRINLYFILK